MEVQAVEKITWEPCWSVYLIITRCAYYGTRGFRATALACGRSPELLRQRLPEGFCSL